MSDPINTTKPAQVTDDQKRRVCDEASERMMRNTQKLLSQTTRKPDWNETTIQDMLGKTSETTISRSRAHIRAALDETLRRYPDAAGALTFFWGASGLGEMPLTADDIAWAKGEMQKHGR